MSEVVTDEQLLEEASEQFLKNVESLDELSRKVSREGLRRIFMTVVRFPYTGDIKVDAKNSNETALFSHAMMLRGLADQITKYSKEDYQQATVDKLVEDIKETLPSQGESNG